jgi:hypothetical protein
MVFSRTTVATKNLPARIIMLFVVTSSSDLSRMNQSKKSASLQNQDRKELLHTLGSVVPKQSKAKQIQPQAAIKENAQVSSKFDTLVTS